MPEQMIRWWVDFAHRERDERGDVPGWVMITLMTATLVMVIWGTAEGALSNILDRAFGMVR
jgi:hypothetical protein